MRVAVYRGTTNAEYFGALIILYKIIGLMNLRISKVVFVGQQRLFIGQAKLRLNLPN